MKKIKIILFSIILFLAFACDESLDMFPLDSVTNETYWETEDHLKAASFPCYDIFYKDLLNLGEGCAETAYWGTMQGGLNKVSGGRHTVTTGFPVTSWWNNSYKNIYNCNVFLDNYNKAEIDQEIKDRYAAEVKTIRAFNYFILTSLFGDVTLVSSVVGVDDPIAYGPRTNRQKVVDWMLEELDWAVEKLGSEIPSGDDIGRINKWGALSLKARVALQNERWGVAAEAAKAVMESGKYELYDNYYKLFQYESNVELDHTNKESIISGMYITDIRTHNLSGELCKPTNYIRFNPSKTLVDAYLCTDGKPAKRGYEYKDNPAVQLSGLYPDEEKEYADYWVNRDPRMAMTVLKPGELWTGGDDGDEESFAVNDTFRLPRFASIQDNNWNGANTVTGFYFTKYCDPVFVNQTRKDANNIHIIRYAEVLLIYAEAKLKQHGTLSQQDIDITINKLRDRVGMHHMILSELNSWGMDLETEIRRERRIELALEGMRLFDIYRWKEGERMGMPVTGPKESILISQLGVNPYASNGVDGNGDVIYEKASASEGDAGRVFDPAKHYLWPVPNVEIIKNPNLGQNPGW
ncbi:RagB/SusD family nutrient uptake outer membrane protein [Mariniphaga sediminis]|uniref:RagB/SusD family nutrient uptake outer membrane protein n=1 Tax=Mariniphaga sediminis TaxID=1628158 RepID=A0A399CXJ4_9BACT|nr:RagB/SusD family nutrient uptake outer membrane protein [Mariniphaga sediminis]RIH62780.1 RagB/SusD family nutrient uptake outer membrane protein [Mariniphaga sediminis]